MPGLGATDVSTALMRKFMNDLGYASYTSQQWRNRGFKDVTHAALLGRLNSIHGQHQRKFSVIGQSLGGVCARELAKAVPGQVRQVITLGSPFSEHSLASTGIRLYGWLSDVNIEDLDFDRLHAIRSPASVPTTMRPLPPETFWGDTHD